MEAKLVEVWAWRDKTDREPVVSRFHAAEHKIMEYVNVLNALELLGFIFTFCLDVFDEE